jgi:5-methylcytosine-specific restriction endonuclease McrA
MTKKPRLTTLKPRVAELPPRLATSSAPSWRTGKTTTGRGYGCRWQKARDQYLRLHPLCVYCLERDGRPVAARIVDHKVPHRGDERLFWDVENWQALCKPCHDSVKAAEERGGA